MVPSGNTNNFPALQISQGCGFDTVIQFPELVLNLGILLSKPQLAFTASKPVYNVCCFITQDNSGFAYICRMRGHIETILPDIPHVFIVKINLQ